MKHILDLHNKKGISVIVGYVVLIAMTISLSVLVFQWLRFYVSGTNIEDLDCPDGTNIIIQESKCTLGLNPSLNLTIKNKGRYTIDGFSLRVNNRTDSDRGFYQADLVEVEMEPGKTYNQNYDLSSDFNQPLSSINIVEVQPFKISNNKTIYCNTEDIVEISCN